MIPFSIAMLLAGFPSFDADYEHVVAVRAGSFVASEAPVADGVVRARIRCGDKTDLAILLRATAFANGDVDEGYGFFIDAAGTFRARRFDHGVERDLGNPVKIDGGVKKGAVLEIVLLAAGPFLSGTVYDGASLTQRAHIELSDGRARSGFVGVQLGKANDAALVSLSAGTGDGKASEVDDGAVNERVVTLSARDAPLLPSIARVLEKRADGATIANVDAQALERMLRAGAVPLAVSARIAFVDEDAQLRATLARGPSGVRVDESYKDATVVAAVLRAYAEKFPQLARIEVIGKTTLGRDIVAIEIGSHKTADVDSVLLDGAHHGGELMSIEFVLDAVQHLLEGYGRDEETTRFVDSLDIWCVPLVNVDGNMRYVHETLESTRKNVDGADGVDLYRNYPADWGGNGEVGSRSNPFHYRYRGPEPASEPEIRAMMALAERERFTASIDFHTNATAILVPYTDPSMTSPEPNELWPIAKMMSDAAGVQSNGKRYSVQRNLYPVDGTYQDWLRNRFGTAALLVEGPRHNPLPYASERKRDVDGTRPVWRTLFARVERGPGFVVHVRDASTGAPLEAEVAVAEQHLHMDEHWQTRPRDGRMHRLLAPGSYTLHIKADGYVDQVKRVVVGEGDASVDVALSRVQARE